MAYEAGFNSLSSFNDAFKKLTKQTPIAYKASSKMAIVSA
ncbi:MAG: hypothetical protein ACQUHE_02640 [Bacteroidia bacterium]